MARESRIDRSRARSRALASTVLFHSGIALSIVFSVRWSPAEAGRSVNDSPLQATLWISAADIQRAQQAVQAVSETNAKNGAELSPPVTLTPQNQSDGFDPHLDQDLVAHEMHDVQEHNVQELNEPVVDQQGSQQDNGRHQRLREAMEAVERERVANEERRHQKEQRLKQLAETRYTFSAKTQEDVKLDADQGLLGRYMAALHAAVRANWDTALVGQGVRCSVRFTQNLGGEVLAIEFLECPHDAQMRDSIERALYQTHMPYSGFEAVFRRQPTLVMCYPDAACSSSMM